MPTTVVVTPSGAKPRYHAFDALRGTAMFLVIGLHAALGYLQRDIPGVLWCVRDAPTTPAFDWFCWWAMGVSNPLYFAIAGFFAVGLYDSKGPRGFLSNRVGRVLVPFLVGVVTVLPATLAVWSYGWLASGRCSLREVLKLRYRDPLIQSERVGSGHLWFLEYLVVMLLAYMAFRWLADRRADKAGPSAGALLDRVLSSRWRLLFLAVPSTVVLWISRQRLGVDSALDRHNSFLIGPEKLFYYATFFAVGAGIYRMRNDLGRLMRPGPYYLALSLPVFVGRAWLLGRDRMTPLVGLESWGSAALGALFSWLVVFGLIGLALRVVQRSLPIIRYLADGSYWIYLIHMPILGLIQVNLYQLPGHALWKFPVVLVGTLAIGLASYQTLVRYTALGTGLHGRRERLDTRATA